MKGLPNTRRPGPTLSMKKTYSLLGVGMSHKTKGPQGQVSLFLVTTANHRGLLVLDGLLKKKVLASVLKMPGPTNVIYQAFPWWRGAKT